jgi:hypothetical protein
MLNLVTLHNTIHYNTLHITLHNNAQIFTERLTFLMGPEAQSVFFKSNDDQVSYLLYCTIGRTGKRYYIIILYQSCTQTNKPDLNRYCNDMELLHGS